MDNPLNDLIEKIVDKKLKESQGIMRDPAEVVSVSTGSSKAVVRFLNGSEYELLNKTGEVLTAGDSVWVEYRTLPSSGYIAMRNGVANSLFSEAETSLVSRFRTNVLNKWQGSFGQHIYDIKEFKLLDIPAGEQGYPVNHVLHIFFASENDDGNNKYKITYFMVKDKSGNIMNTQHVPIWVGKEAYLPLKWYTFDTELYVKFENTEQWPNNYVKFHYDVYRMKDRGGISEDDPNPWYVYYDDEGAGSIRYSEFVRYVCEELQTIKNRLDNL